jgi:hypothetical protein
MNIPLIPLDKANHFIYGFVIYFIANLFLNPFISLGVVLLFALGKEVVDEINYKGFDKMDLLVTLLPAVLLVLKTLIKK